MVTEDRSSVATPTNLTEAAMASTLRVRIDQDACTGDGLCVQLAPAVFEFDVDGLAYVKGPDGQLRTKTGESVPVPLPLVDDVVAAADDCPGTCIYVQRPDGTLEAGPGV
ncbi:ferredoxin [Frankia sp. Cas4]|uniref:ferredoxin n=1 Tax=Frankia sp. Cas4 TaxID=3073927 RepID=UPI003A102CF6